MFKTRRRKKLLHAKREHLSLRVEFLYLRDLHFITIESAKRGISPTVREGSKMRYLNEPSLTVGRVPRMSSTH